MDVDRKVVVVTGAPQGLGEAFVQAYRERGWRADRELAVDQAV